MKVFEIVKKDKETKARAGKLFTAHGEIMTPIFMPVGTQATVKAVHQQELKDDIGAQIILGNTYHLYLRPGTDVINAAGGLHKFMDWDLPLLTDSGGYQVYSLSSRRKIKESGVRFHAHVDGSIHEFTPESSIRIQRDLGADIIMAFDECTPFPCDYNYAKDSMHRTHRWLERCIEYDKANEPLYGFRQVLAPIVQGSVYDDLRVESAEYIASKEMAINAIGGLSVGEPEEELYKHTEIVCNVLPVDKPRYLMGVGTPANILEAISLGIDMFDCVLPSRNARHGMLYTKDGIINIKNKKWEKDFSPIDELSTSALSRKHSKAYLRHLVHVKEYLAAQIATIHNLSFYLWLVQEARQQIVDGTFSNWKKQMIPKLKNRL
jgi:queuine tRNA-ribosyltransferase